jgi:hypothetical protein
MLMRMRFPALSPPSKSMLMRIYFPGFPISTPNYRRPESFLSQYKSAFWLDCPESALPASGNPAMIVPSETYTCGFAPSPFDEFALFAAYSVFRHPSCVTSKKQKRASRLSPRKHVPYQCFAFGSPAVITFSVLDPRLCAPAFQRVCPFRCLFNFQTLHL